MSMFTSDNVEMTRGKTKIPVKGVKIFTISQNKTPIVSFTIVDDDKGNFFKIYKIFDEN